MQQKIDAIDNAGRALVRLESEAMCKLNVGQRLQVLQDKIVGFARELMHFDHFAIRLLDRKNNKLEPVICLGLPREAMDVELYAEAEGHGISGYVAATGRSYICPDVQRDARYVKGLEGARSSLTVPMLLHEKVIGIFNIESRQKAAFTEDDRQFAEIFGRYVAMALNILDLLVGERVITRHNVADDVASELAGPLNDIASDVAALNEDYIGNDELRGKLRQIAENVVAIRTRLRQAAEGPRAVLGAGEVKSEADPVISAARVLVADDEPNLRSTIRDVLGKHGAVVTIVSSGVEAIGLLERQDFDLVVSDIKMPDKSGYEVFAAARRRSQTVPVILMTGFGYDPSHTIVRASQEGLQAVLFKPFKVGQLIAEVRRALQPAHVQR
jgi:CheY-like chemotaxis protein